MNTKAIPRRIGAAEQANVLLELCGGLDRLEHKRGTKLIYAIDSNIVDLLCQPSEKAVSRKRDGIVRQGWGEILETDPEELQEIVAHALAEHLYIHLRKHAPLLMIPPVTREIHDYANALASRTVRPRPADRENWNKKARRLLDRLADLGTFGTKGPPLIHRVQEVLFLEYGPPAAARRLRFLLTTGRIINSDVAAKLEGMPPEVRTALHPFRFVDSATMFRRRDEWMDAGLETGNTTRKEAERRDAAVLVRLEQINRELLSTSTYQLVYLTADRNMLEVVEKENNPYIQIHHPRAWLTRLQIFQRGGSEGETGVDEPTTSLADLLKLVAYEPDPTSPTQADGDVVSKWNAYLQTATTAFAPAEDSKNLFFDEARDMVNRYSAQLERLESNIVELQKEAWNDCFEATAIAAATEAQLSQRDYARSVPCLVFEEWQDTDFVINTFLTWHRPEEFDDAFFKEGLAKIDKDDPSGYARYIALATIFASRGEWDVADTLIKRAWEAKSEGASIRGGPNGREASFLEAVCRRHLAKSPIDLDEVHALLTRAEEITIAEYGSLDGPGSVVVPERFRGEHLANEITRFYMDRYDKKGVRNDDQKRLKDLALTLGTLLEDVAGRLQSGTDLVGSVQYVALQQLLYRTIINILGLALIAERQLPIFGRAYEVAEGLGLHTSVEDPHLSAVSRLTMIAYRRVVLNERAVRLRDLLSKLLAEDENGHFDRILVFPYDRVRFAEIRARVFPFR